MKTELLPINNSELKESAKKYKIMCKSNVKQINSFESMNSSINIHNRSSMIQDSGVSEESSVKKMTQWNLFQKSIEKKTEN
jgi:hypothetical protein